MYEIIGKVSGIKGLKGELKVKFGKSQLYKAENAVLIYIKEGGTFLPFKISKRTLELSGEGILKLDGIDSPEVAANYIHKEVFFQADEIKIREIKTPGDWFSIKGYTLYDYDREVGIIEDIYEMPGQFIAAIQYNNNEILVPLLPSFVNKMDENKKEIYMTLPDGLMEVYTDTTQTDKDED